MELRQLRYFVAVAEERNISRAAQKIFLTQSALSRQIKALEDEIGQCLLERQAHSIRLTSAGETLLDEARELLRHAEAVLERVRTAGGELRLRVGYAPSLAAGILAGAVASFTQVHPKARVELFDLSTAEMLAGLEKGELDVVVTAAPEAGLRGLDWTPILRTPWRLAVARRHPLARRARATPEDVAKERLLVFCRKDYPEYWEIVSGWLRAHGQQARVAGEFDGVNSLMSAVESGQGVAILAAGKRRFVPEDVGLRTLSPAPGPLCIAAGRRADRVGDRPLAVFVEELRNAAEASA